MAPAPIPMAKAVAQVLELIKASQNTLETRDELRPRWGFPAPPGPPSVMAGPAPRLSG